IRLITQANQGPATARNRGAAEANGRYLAFTDDDCMPDPTWLTALATQFEQTPSALIGGRTINALPQNMYAETSQLLVDYLYEAFAGSANAFFTSNNFAMAKSLFDDLAGFRSEMPLAAGEDREFCDRWQMSGRELMFVPEAVVNHGHGLTAVTFWRQHVNYGCGAWQYHQLRAAHQQHALKLEPFSFYRNLLLFPLQRYSNVRGIVLMILLAVTQMANATGFFSEKLKLWRVG
ncbi:MAG: glycosyltransferase, partial [Chloroflexi bacterium]|nr:glycosyltransferase [Chloroflexota bacterium]